MFGRQNMILTYVSIVYLVIHFLDSELPVQSPHSPSLTQSRRWAHTKIMKTVVVIPWLMLLKQNTCIWVLHTYRDGEQRMYWQVIGIIVFSR